VTQSPLEGKTQVNYTALQIKKRHPQLFEKYIRGEYQFVGNKAFRLSNEGYHMTSTPSPDTRTRLKEFLGLLVFAVFGALTRQEISRGSPFEEQLLDHNHPGWWIVQSQEEYAAHMTLLQECLDYRASLSASTLHEE
jgi:hypothetical protein